MHGVTHGLQWKLLCPLGHAPGYRRCTLHEVCSPEATRRFSFGRKGHTAMWPPPGRGDAATLSPPLPRTGVDRRRTTSRPRPGRPDLEGAGGRAAGCMPWWYVPGRPAAHTRTSSSPGEHEPQKQSAFHQPRIVGRGARQSAKARLRLRPGHMQGSRIRWRRRPGPAPGASGQSSAAGPWPTVCPHQQGTWLHEIYARTAR